MDETFTTKQIPCILDGCTAEQVELLRQKANSRNAHLESHSRFFTELYEVTRDSGLIKHQEMANTCLFLNTAAHDSAILILLVIQERNESAAKFLYRMLALQIYEIADDLPQVFGRFRKLARELKVPLECTGNLDAHLSRANTFRQNNVKFLKELRDSAAAHRNHDAYETQRVVDNMDAKVLFLLAMEQGEVINALAEAAQETFKYLAKQLPRPA